MSPEQEEIYTQAGTSAAREIARGGIPRAA